MLHYLDDNHPLENWVSQRNRARQYDFMNTAYVVWEASGRPEISHQFIRELNFYAAHMLSPHPGVYRNQCQQNVYIRGTAHQPPSFERVPEEMDAFLSTIQKMRSSEAPLIVAAYALWRLNWIHPFVQGNGRTSRALCSFLVNQGYNKWLPGTPLVELIRDNRDEYCELLRVTDETADENKMADLSKLVAFLERLLFAEINRVRAASLQEPSAGS